MEDISSRREILGPVLALGSAKALARGMVFPFQGKKTKILMRFRLLFFGILAGFSGLGSGEATHLVAQEGPRWTFSGSPGADLWFHGMAMVDPMGPGSSPLYDLEYPNRVRVAKGESEVGSTPLDRSAGRFHEAFSRDPSFEVLHFLPLYFAGTGRVEMIAALKLLATARTGIPQAPTPQTSLGLAAVGSVLRTPEQRALLGEFIVVLEAEWSSFLNSQVRSRAAESEVLAREVQRSWDERFRPGMGPFLDRVGLTGGRVILAPALGLEGRVFSGPPQSWRDNAVAVQAPRDQDRPEQAVYLLLRELAFSLSREVGREAGVVGDDVGDEKMVAIGAIRAGAMLLDAVHPREAMGFKKFFLDAGGYGVPDGDIAGAFVEAFPMDSAYLDALREAIEVN
jgi:hypothetical protein